jgi:hypothetical protein
MQFNFFSIYLYDRAAHKPPCKNNKNYLAILNKFTNLDSV